MASRGSRIQTQYEQFKKEAKLVTLKSQTSNKTTKIVRYRGETFYTGSIQEVFNRIKDRIT